MERTLPFLKQYVSRYGWKSPAVQSFFAPVLVAVAYYLGAQAAFSVGTLSDRIFAPFWPPNVILFCTLLLVPQRMWWRYIAAVFPAHVIAELTVGMPPVQNLVAFATNCMVAILSAWAIKRFLRESPWFGTLRNTAIYIAFAAGLSPAISALGGAFVQILGGGPIENYWTYWANWAISNALGAMTLGPLFLIWSGLEGPPYSLRRKTEATVLAVALVVGCAIAFRVGEHEVNTGFLPAVLYSPLPFILWAAIRFGERGASGAILVVTVVSIWQSLRTSTVFIGPDAGTSVLALQIFLLGVAIPVFLLGTAIDELRRSGEATRKLAGALLRAQDEERRRIARELHDSTGQNLVMANLMASRIQSEAPASCGPAVAELKEILQGTMSEIRTVSYLLHPPLLEGAGLNIALQSYVQGFSNRTEIGVDLQICPSVGRLSSDVELVLFRVIQEGLTNIWRHSGSKTARIELARKAAEAGDEITLRIEDAGKGMPQAVRRAIVSKNSKPTAPSGLGLIGMRERLHQIGGRLEIDSASGRTELRAVVTLNAESNLS